MSPSLPQRVKLVEVGPRDGLQNEQHFVPNEVKIELTNRLSLAGFQNIEAVAFVSPKWVPQMAGSSEVMQGILRRSGTLYSALVPNMQGYELARAAKVDEVVIFSAASESFAKKNINCSIDESISRFEPIAQAAKRDGIRLRGSISCAFYCPYEGRVAVKSTQAVVAQLAQLGCDEIDICDTIGMATVEQVKEVFGVLASNFDVTRLAGHFHDTYGQALANIFASLQMGVEIFHSSIAGLGGCPYAKGATGNVATEDVLYLMHGLGIETGIDFEPVARAGDYISQMIGRPNGSRAGRAWLAKHA